MGSVGRKRDVAEAEREASEQSGRRARMKTIGRDDELITRGVNPRTGLISPWVKAKMAKSVDTLVVISAPAL